MLTRIFKMSSRAASSTGPSASYNKNLIKLISALFLLSFLPTLAFADNEQILGFYSQIHVNVDASIDVSEQITVYANNDKILHGIVRRLPLRYRDSYGVDRNTDYKITSVLFNDKTSPYHINRSNKQLAVYVGSADLTLAPGIYTYTIGYHVNNAINFLKDADELYWNVTGNEWDFPIVKARADVFLPTAAEIGLYNAYTGVTGSQEKHFVADKIAANQIIFQTTQLLYPNQGFTIGVSWQKGIVHQPTWQQLVLSSDKSPEIIILELALLTLVYYLFVWYQYGKDPRKGTIIPLFEPPTNLSPAAVRYLMKMGYDMKILTVTIVQMAVKGLLVINDSGSERWLTKQKQEKETDLEPEEKAIMDTLFKRDITVSLSNANATYFKQAKERLNATLSERYQNNYFVTNFIYLIPGMILALLACGIAVFSADETEAAIFMLVWVSIWSSVCMGLLYKVFYNLSSLSLASAAGTIFLILMTLPFLAGEVAGLYALGNAIPMLTIPLLALIGVTNYIFYILMKAPTVEGRKVMDQIEGFKLFLATTERYRLDQLNPPHQSPQLFEKYLPYAIALDVENRWGEQFNNYLIQAGLKPDSYHPAWYTGSNWRAMQPAAFVALLSSNLNSSLALASIPVSKGGSGGGGFSGGGGGGGGGGGW